MQHYRLTLKSSNAKTGPIPVSTTSSDSCPAACPLRIPDPVTKRPPCYAYQQPLLGRWGEVDAGKFSTGIEGFCVKIALLPEGTLWRHNQASDLPGQGDAIDGEATRAIAEANRGKRGFTFTHKPVLPGASGYRENAAIIAAANKIGFTINLSGNSLAHADKLSELGIAPVVTLLPVEYGRKAKGEVWLETLEDYRARVASLPKTTPDGRAVAVCPATYLDTNCARCGLRQRQNRRVIPGFPGHGLGRRRPTRWRAADILEIGREQMTQLEILAGIAAMQRVVATNPPSSEAWQRASRVLHALIEQLTGKALREACGKADVVARG